MFLRNFPQRRLRQNATGYQYLIGGLMLYSSSPDCAVLPGIMDLSII